MSKNDCLRQCVARVVGMRPSRVPHFVGRYRGRWSWHLGRWCERRGWKMVLAKHYHGSTVVGVKRWISIGMDRKGVCHAVVVERDRGTVYDGGYPLRRHQRVLVIIK